MPWLLFSLLILLLALALKLGFLAYAMYVVVGLLRVSRYLTRHWTESLAAERECNRHEVEIGERVAVRVVVTNRGRWPIPWVLLDDLLPRRTISRRAPSLKVTGSRNELAMLRRGEQKTMFYELECQQRGYFQIGPTMVETGDLFGLQRRYLVLSEPAFVMVYPQVVPLEGFDIASRRPIGEVLMTHRLFEDPTRIAGVRMYERGDPLNRIHWRATARTGSLHSKVYEPSTVAGVTILLDFHESGYDPSQEPFRSETAVVLAASLASAVYHMGQQVGLITNGRDAADRIRQEGWSHDYRTRGAARHSAEMRDSSDRLRPLLVPTLRGPEQFLRIRELLARVEFTDGLSFADLISETSSRMPRDASVVAIVSRLADENLIALTNLRRQGYAVTAILNLYDNYEFSQAAGKLWAAGVEVRHLAGAESISTICRQQVLAQSK